MKLHIEVSAQKWFAEEVGIPAGAGIRFKAKIYGSSPVNDTFALQIEPSKPRQPIAEFKGVDGVYYFIEKDDEWFFQNHDLIVSFNEDHQEPKYIYRKDGIDKV